MSIITEYTYDDYVFSDTTDYSELFEDYRTIKNLSTQLCEHIFNVNVKGVQSGSHDYTVFTWGCKNLIISLCMDQNRVQTAYLCFTQLDMSSEPYTIKRIHALHIEKSNQINVTDIGINTGGRILLGGMNSPFILPPKSFFLAGMHKDIITTTDLRFENTQMEMFQKNN